MQLVVLAVAAVVHGSVTIGPLTPVCRVGTPCEGPAKGTIVTFSRAGRSISAKTDMKGRFRLTLTAGSWRVRANRGTSIEPRTILVRAADRRADFSIDTGIR